MPRSREGLPDPFESTGHVDDRFVSNTRRLALLGGFLLDGKNLFTFVVSAIRAHVVRQARLMAVGTCDEVRGSHREMAPPTIPSSLG